MSRKPVTLARVRDGVLKRWFDRRNPINSFRGVYPSFAAALDAAPPFKRVGYDVAGSVDWYSSKMSCAPLEDYPVMYWLRSAFADSSSIFEVGGHVGTAYYGFQGVLDYPDDLRWTIWDVPSIVAAGRDLAVRKGSSLEFTEDPLGEPEANVLMAAGALQYIDQPRLEDFVATRAGHLRHVLINLTPVHDGPEFVTLQNIGPVVCPYRIFNRRQLIGKLEELGYCLVDSWEKPRPFRVEGRNDLAFDTYSGFYFRCEA